jgi:undecaprenyl diphosphate synthase
MEIFGETIERELPDPGQAGRAHALHRPPRPRPGLAAGDDGGARGETAANDRLSLWIAFDYGGRRRAGRGDRRLIEAGVAPGDVDEDALAAHLYAPELPDPDLLIRTSGELRLSNFLLWQLAYAELVFVETLWPDFGEADLRSALADYANRRRRFGGR